MDCAFDSVAYDAVAFDVCEEAAAPGAWVPYYPHVPRRPIDEDEDALIAWLMLEED